MPSATAEPEEPLILSALNDFLYCPRRCALHRVEGLWEDNVHTLSGVIAHQSVDDPGYRQTVDALGTVVRIERALPLFCRRLNLLGKADIVEFHRAGRRQGAEAPRHEGSDTPVAEPAGPFLQARMPVAEGPDVPIPRPVDYKLGPRRAWDNDDVQLCAQALCLEEMFGRPVPAGAIYHVRTRRRREVPFTPALRQLTLQTIADVRRLLAEARVPPATLRPQCEGCSLHALCLPELADGEALRRARQSLFQPL
jgi:CRISPR-associated exonuclease Cas4